MACTSTLKAWLAPGIHMAWIGEDVVVLSIPDDGYSCLVGAARHVHQAEDGAVHVSSHAVLKDLEAAGFVTRSQPPNRQETPILAKRELTPVARSGVGRALVVAIGSARDHAVFQSLSFPQLIDAARDLRRGRPPVDAMTSAETIATVGAFMAVLPWLPFEGVCLHRAFLLLRSLARRGVRADWVFGVRTWPFSAHCWVQIGDTVVADRLSRVGGYTPILVV